jgi:hypothetical protein
MAMNRDVLVSAIKQLGRLTAEGRVYTLEPKTYRYAIGGNSFILWGFDQGQKDVAIKFFFRPRATAVDRERFQTEISILRYSTTRGSLSASPPAA